MNMINFSNEFLNFFFSSLKYIMQIVFLQKVLTFFSLLDQEYSDKFVNAYWISQSMCVYINDPISSYSNNGFFSAEYTRN